MEKTSEKLVRKNLAIMPKLNDMVEEIREKKGLKSFVSVIELAINELHQKTFKDYVAQRLASAGKTPEEKAETQIKIQELKKQKEEDALLAIATALEGKIVRNDGGGKTVKYFTYDKRNRYLQELPLSMMTEELIESQYFPSKEEVLKNQEEGKVNYTPGTWE